MYVASDPRARLASTASSKPLHKPSSANYARFYATEPQEQSELVRSWYAQAQNFVTVYSETQAGAVLLREDQPDEYAILLPDPDCRVIVEWEGERQEIAGHSIVLVPPGRSQVEIVAPGRVVRFFTVASADIVAACPPGYDNDPNVAPYEPWPEPVGGNRIRSYSMDIPAEPGRLGRIFRSRNFLINYIYPRSGPRDRNTLSPHSHADFQQCSLCLEGSYRHHLRWPWGNRADDWREDEHAHCDSPSVTIIPAQVIHTTEAIGEQTNLMIDVFSPPRHDFSRQPGWVLNADEYPEPDA